MTTDARSAAGGTAHCTALRYPHIHVLCCNTVTSWYVPTDTDIVTDVQTPPMIQQMGGDQPHPMNYVQCYRVGGASGRGTTPPYPRHPQYSTPPMQYPGVMYPNQMTPGMGPNPSQSTANMGMTYPQSQLPNIPCPIPGAPTPPHPILSPYSYHQSVAPPSSLPATPAVPMTTATTSQVVSNWYQYGGEDGSGELPVLYFNPYMTKFCHMATGVTPPIPLPSMSHCMMVCSYMY